LDLIGSQLRRDYMEAFLQAPVAVRVALVERMPKLGVTAAEARILADHMARTLVDDGLSGGVPMDSEAVAAGKGIFDRLGCIACHIVGNGGGFVGPDLNGSGARLLPGWTVAFLMSPEQWKPRTLQPDYGLARKEAESVTAYVLSLPPRKGQLAP
jgi:mono/diheme cytochrome c family protein